MNTVIVTITAQIKVPFSQDELDGKTLEQKLLQTFDDVFSLANDAERLEITDCKFK